MRKVSYIFKHQYKPEIRRIDEESKTVPDLVLSMRDVYRKYVLTGNLEGIAVSPLVIDDRLMEELPEETTDSLLMAQQLRESVEEDTSALAGRHRSVSGDKHPNAGVQESEDNTEDSATIRSKPDAKSAEKPATQSELFDNVES